MCFRELGKGERIFFLHNMAHGGTDASPQAAKGGQQDQVPKSVPPSGFTIRFYFLQDQWAGCWTSLSTWRTLLK